MFRAANTPSPTLPFVFAVVLLSCGLASAAPPNKPVEKETAKAAQLPIPGRLKARLPTAKLVKGTKAETGIFPLAEGERGGKIFVPVSYDGKRPAPLVVYLHGKGADAWQGLRLAQAHAEAAGALLLLPESKAATWDILAGGFGPDVAALDAALASTFAKYSVDPKRVVIAGFSDGASYALSLGMKNGDVFTHVLAFSPGFGDNSNPVGKPKLRVAHGKADKVFALVKIQDRVLRRLKDVGQDIQLVEFDGGHTVTEELVGDGFKWALAEN